MYFLIHWFIKAHIIFLQLGLLNGMYGGLGQSVGAIIGGNMSRVLGIVRTFSIAAMFDFVLILTLITFHLRKYYSSKDDGQQSG